MRSRISILVFAAALCWILEGQTTWIVDSSNGPGTSFTDLPPAVAAAMNGDTIVVRAGTYAPFHSIGKALTIRGAGAASTTLGAAPSGSSITETKVDGVPAGMTFLMSGLKFAPVDGSGPPFPFPPPNQVNAALHLLGPGTVVLTDVTIRGAAMQGGGTMGLFVTNGAEVHLSRSTVNGGTVNSGWNAGIGVVVSDANLAVDASTITGGNIGVATLSFPASGMYVNGVATLSRSSVYGGTGFYAGSNGVETGTGFIRIAGTAANVIQGGPALFGGTPQPQGITIVASPSGSVVVHGSVSILPSSPGQPLTSGSVTIGAVALPYLSMTGTSTPSGELVAAHPVTVTFNGVIPFAPFALIVDSSPWFSTALAYVLEGELLMPIPTVIALEGFLDAAGLVQGMLIPAVHAPSLTDIPIYLQFAVLDSTAGKLRMSNGLVRMFAN